MFEKINQALKEKPWLWVVVVLCAPLLPFLLPAIVPAFMIVVLKRVLDENQANDRAPIESVAAVVVTKRSQVSGGGDMTTSTRYYATFELENGGGANSGCAAASTACSPRATGGRSCTRGRAIAASRVFHSLCSFRFTRQ